MGTVRYSNETAQAGRCNQLPPKFQICQMEVGPQYMELYDERTKRWKP